MRRITTGEADRTRAVHPHASGDGRGDEREADLLGDTCPQRTYRCDDLDFRDRMKRAYMVTAMVALNLRAGLARIRMANAFQRKAHPFAVEVGRFATAAYLCGRSNGRQEAGLASARRNDPDAVAVELVAAGGFDDQNAEIRDVAEEVVRELAGGLHGAVGRIRRRRPAVGGRASAGSAVIRWEWSR